MSQLHPRTTLIFGGARSGKSRYAETLCLDSDLALFYLATAPFMEGDAEFSERIRLHKERRGPRWTLLEEQTDLVSALEGVNSPDNAILIDCMTLWLNNLIFHQLPINQYIEALLQWLGQSRAKVILITNEVGQGIVPLDRDSRMFRDEQGRLNQLLASSCNRVIEVRAGLPMLLKPSTQPAIAL